MASRSRDGGSRNDAIVSEEVGGRPGLASSEDIVKRTGLDVDDIELIREHAVSIIAAELFFGDGIDRVRDNIFERRENEWGGGIAIDRLGCPIC